MVNIPYRSSESLIAERLSVRLSALRRTAGAIVLSHGGTRRYSRDALARVKAAGGAGVVVTGRAAEAPPDADWTLRTVEQESSGAHTVSYTTALSLLATLAATTGGKADVALLPLPTGPRDLKRLKPLFRYDVYRRHYGSSPVTDAYLQGPIATTLAERPQWLDEQLARIADELAQTPRWVYASRDKGFDPEAPEEPPAATGSGGSA